MFLDPRVIILFAANALLLFLCLLVNSSLAPHSLYLVLLGPMLVLPALYLNHRSFFLCTLISGLWVDAALPSAFGLFTCGFIAIGTLIAAARIRFRAEHNYHPILLAHLANACCILLLTVSEGLPYLSSPAFWGQVLITTLLSHTVLLIIAPWFFNLERLLFELCHVETEPDDFPML
ncbi:MAG: cell shape-determining protein MreD [Lentimonas sp.]|jgi:cell shape-determining protein MreD